MQIPHTLCLCAMNLLFQNHKNNIPSTCKSASKNKKAYQLSDHPNNRTFYFHLFHFFPKLSLQQPVPLNVLPHHKPRCLLLQGCYCQPRMREMLFSSPLPAFASMNIWIVFFGTVLVASEGNPTQSCLSKNKLVCVVVEFTGLSHGK